MSDLTATEYVVLRARAEGIPIKALAERLGSSDQTVKNHITAAYRKLGVDNLAGALGAMGWLTLPTSEDHPTCDFVAKCGRWAGHRGHHGGFRGIVP